MGKQSLYYFDSSDDESTDELVNVEYKPKKILDTLKDLPPYLGASYILTEVSQSILAQQTVQEKYTKLKNHLAQNVKIPENVGFYSKANKFLGRFLIEEGFTSTIDLDEQAKVLIENISYLGKCAKVFLSNKDIFAKYVSYIFQENQESVIKEQGFEINLKIKLQNKCLEICTSLLNMSQVSTKSSNIYQLTKEILKNYNNNLLLSSILKTLQEEEAVNFQKFEEKLKLLEGKTIKDFIGQVVTSLNTDLIKESYNNLIREVNPVTLKADEDVYTNIFFLKKEQKIEQQKKLLGQYNEFIMQYFSKDYIELCYTIDEENKEYVDKNKFALFISYVLDDEEGIIKNINSVLAQYFSKQNELIAKELIAYREMYLSLFPLAEDFFVNFKLDHRIVKAKLKANGILQKQETIYSARTIENTKVNVQTKLTINSGGTREDYKFLPSDQGSYESVAIELNKFGKVNFKEIFQNILHGKELNNFILSQQLYLYRLADLLFNCEGERNVSAFLTNAMFFELVERGTYNIKDLTNMLPMAMKGAIQASRYTLDMLGGKYGEENLTNYYLTKRQYFDYKTTTFKKNFISEKITQTQQELKEVLLHYELALKDRIILSDWVSKGHDSSTDHLIILINTVNRIYDVNAKEFNGCDVSYTERKNMVCISELRSLFKKIKLQAKDNTKEKLIEHIDLLKKTPKNELDPINLQSLAKDIEQYVGYIKELEYSIKSDLNIFKNIDSIDQCIEMVKGYNDISYSLSLKLNEELLFTKKKLIKPLIKSIKLEEINDFDQLNKYSAQLIDKIPNFTSILLESIKNFVDQHISKLPEIKINEKNLKELKGLINEWYKLDLDYLAQELKGSDLKKETNIGWINSYFTEYTLDALNNILDLRLKDLQLKDILIFKGIFIDQHVNNITELLFRVMGTKAETVLVPLNLFNKHAVGLIFNKITNDLTAVKYFDPENKPIPVQLEQIFKDYGLSIEQLVVEQQKYSNCSPKVIEDFILYLTGSCLSQEEAIPYHSYLVEQNLLSPQNYEMVELSGCSNI